MTGYRRPLFFAAVRVYAAALITVLSTMIIARLLRPEEIGVYTIAAGLMGLVSVFRDLGISNYLVREPSLDAGHIGTCYVITLAASWLLAFCFAAIAPFAADFYGAPGLREVLLILALNLLIIPMNSIRLALLRREQRFDILLYIDLSGACAYNVVALVLAWQGASYMALAWGTFAALLVGVLATSVAWHGRPRIRLAWGPWREVMSFGGYATGASIITTLQANLPEMIVGKAMGLHHAAILSRAQGLLRARRLLVIGAVDSVIYAVTAQKHRDGEALAADYLRISRYVSAVAWPFFGCLGLLAYPLVRVLFGPNWDEAAALLEIIALNGLAMPFYSFNASFLTAIGAIRTHFFIQLAALPLKTGAWCLTSWFDLRVAAMAFVLAHGLHVALSIGVVGRRLDFGPRALLVAVAPSVPLALAACAVPAWLHVAGLRSTWGDVPVLAAGLTGAAIFWLACAFLTGHPIKDEIVLGARRLIRTSRAPVTNP